MQSFIHRVIHPCSHSSMESCTHAVIHPWSHSPMQSPIHGVIHPRSHPSMESSTHTVIHPCFIFVPVNSESRIVKREAVSIAYPAFVVLFCWLLQTNDCDDNIDRWFSLEGHPTGLHWPKSDDNDDYSLLQTCVLTLLSMADFFNCIL